MSKTNADIVKSIGLVAWQALPAIDSAYGKSVGGLETGAWTFAKGLAASNRFAVTIFVSARKRVSQNRVSGVRISPRYNRIEAIRREVSSCLEISPRPRLKCWSSKLLWQVPFLIASRPFRNSAPAPMEADPRLDHACEPIDIWCGFGANGDSARVAATAKKQNRPMLLFLESNADLVFPNNSHSGIQNAYGENAAEQAFAICNATRVICQSRWQMEQLENRFNIVGDLIRNPIDIDQWKRNALHNREGVLWVGRYDDFHKRTHLAIEIAKRCPEIPFKMIINRSGKSMMEDEIRRKCPRNVVIVDFVPFAEISSYFSRSKVFLSTGHPGHEGFPNVLLQAAASETPVVSLFDFDEFLSNSNAGISCDDSLDRAVLAIREFHAGREIDWNGVRSYLDEKHSLQVVVEQFTQIIQAIDKPSS